MNIYESEQLLSEYLLFHYGEERDILPYDFGPHTALNFAVRCVTELLPLAGRSEFGNAVDIGCAVGRSSFELARVCKHVTGIDFSARFVEAANYVKEHGQISFDATEEGKRVRRCFGTLPSDIDRTRVDFETGDAQHLEDKLDGADLVLASNLICRLQEPMRFFSRLPELVRQEGVLLICSPYTWMENFTPLENWIGAKNPQDFSAFETIEKILVPDFELLGTREIPFLIREHARKFQWSVSHGSIWQRK
ncbi:MAG: putative 4-mercaptohistidine N1-methyltransferase [Chthoniobacterales bacterium]